MTFEAPQNIPNEEVTCNPTVAQEVNPNTLLGLELEAAFKAGAIQDEELTSKQRLELHNKGYQVTLPQGEVTLH